jgi:hypothetical protein
MMCAHHPPAGGASLDLPAGQHLSEKILDGDRLRPGAGKYPWMAVVGMYAVPVAWNLVAIVISASGPNPYADSWYMLAKFFYALVVAVAIVAVVWVWQSVIARVWYRREVR